MDQMESREIPAPLRMVVTCHLQATTAQLEQLVEWMRFLAELEPLFKVDMLFAGPSWSVVWAFVCDERVAEALGGVEGVSVVGPVRGIVRFGEGAVGEMVRDEEGGNGVAYGDYGVQSVGSGDLDGEDFCGDMGWSERCCW